MHPNLIVHILYNKRVVQILGTNILKMNYRREFDIGWYGLAQGIHTFEYEVDNAKLERLGFAPIEEVSALDAKIKLTFDKKSSFFLLKFEIEANTTVACDRCGDDFEMELWDDFDLIVKLVHDVNADEDQYEASEDDDIVFISRTETVINITDWIHEFLILSFPIQKVHPDDAKGSSTCNQKALAVLDSLIVTEETIKEEEPMQDAKDIWKDLGKFKF